jgi:non-canonical (house-cleaning) NTP pyrophosphatase
LGDADDIVTNRVNSKQGGGTVGVLTNNLVTRSLYYEQAVVLALVSHINTEVYDTSFEDVKEHDKVQEMLLHTT